MKLEPIVRIRARVCNGCHSVLLDMGPKLANFQATGNEDYASCTHEETVRVYCVGGHSIYFSLGVVLGAVASIFGNRNTIWKNEILGTIVLTKKCKAEVSRRSRFGPGPVVRVNKVPVL